MAKKVNVEEENMENFSWDDADKDSDEFFGQKKEVGDTELTEEEKKEVAAELAAKEKDEKDEKDDKSDKSDKSGKENEEKDEKENEEEESHEFFAEEKTDLEKENETEDEDDDEKFFGTLAKSLKEKGILASVEIPEEGIDEEVFVDLYENEIEARITDTFEGFFEEMDDDGKAFLKFKKDGGSTADFMAQLKSTAGYPTGDIEDANFQKEVLRYYYNNVEKLDEDDITDKLEWLEETDKLDKYAKKSYKQLDEIDKKSKAEIVKNQEAIVAKTNAENKKFEKGLKEEIRKLDNIKDFPLKKTEKEDLITFITKPAVKIGKNNYITAFQAELQKISSNYEGLILLAKLVKSDFDFSSIKTTEKTKQTRTLKKDLQRSRMNKKPTSSGSSSRKSLSEFF